MAGSGGSLAANVALGIVDPRPPVIVILINLAATVLAGYVAGRFAADSSAPINGGIAGVLVFVALGAVALLRGASPHPFEVVALAVVAAVLGSAGGVLADRRRYV